MEEGKFNFSLRHDQVLQEEQLDGCCVILTNLGKEKLSAAAVFHASQQLNQVQQSFRTYHTTSTYFCPISLEDRINAQAFLSMLSYYLQWHMNKKLEQLLTGNGAKRIKQKTFHEAIDKLKGIRSQTIQIAGISIHKVNTSLDEEQNELVSALHVAFGTKRKD